MPGLAPLTRVAVPAFSISSRAARAAGLPVPAASAMSATALPGLAASAADTAAAGLSAAVAVPGAGAGSVAACAALGAVSGLVFVRAISWLHFISGGIPICLRPVISGRQSLCTGYEVKPLRRYFPLLPETMNSPPGASGINARRSLAGPASTWY